MIIVQQLHRLSVFIGCDNCTKKNNDLWTVFYSIHSSVSSCTSTVNTIGIHCACAVNTNCVHCTCAVNSEHNWYCHLNLEQLLI